MSFLTRSHRRLAAGFAVAALAFAHVAIAAHGCLQDKMPEPQMACDEHHRDAPNDLLCRAHFQAETQTLDLAKVPQLFPFNAPVLAVERAVAPVRIGVRLPVRIALASAPPPPLTVLYSRFLI